MKLLSSSRADALHPTEEDKKKLRDRAAVAEPILDLLREDLERRKLLLAKETRLSALKDTPHRGEFLLMCRAQEEAFDTILDLLLDK